MISLGLLGSWTDDAFPFFFAGHLLLGRGADGSVGEAGAASEGGEAVSSLVGYVKGLVGFGILPYLQKDTMLAGVLTSAMTDTVPGRFLRLTRGRFFIRGNIIYLPFLALLCRWFIICLEG